MSIFRVYIPPEAEGSFSENFMLLRDGKAIFALIAPPVWLIWHRLWIPLMVYLVIAVTISLMGAWQPGPAVALLSGLPGLYLLLEGRELVAGKLKAKGWQEVGIVEARNKNEAEIKYIVEANKEPVALKPAAVNEANKSGQIKSAHAGGPSIGLFPE